MGQEHEPFSGDGNDDDNFMIDGDLTSNIPPEGEYEGKLIDLGKAVAQNSGNDMWVWCFQILKAQSDGDTKYDEWEGKVYTVLNDASMWKMNQVLQGLGLGRVQDGRIKAEFSKAEAINRRCILEIKHEEYRGQPQAKIDTVGEHPDGAGYKPAGPGM